MSTGARVDSDSPRRLVAAVRRLLTESESTASSALAAVRAEVDGAQRELSSRKRQLDEARRRLAEAEAALANCQRNPRASCGALERALRATQGEVRKHESRVRVAQDALAELRRQSDRLASAQRRLLAWQRQSAEGAWRDLAAVSASLEAYLANAPPSAESGGGWSGPPAASGSAGTGDASQGGQRSSEPKFSSEAVASSWAQGFATRAGRAYFGGDEGGMRALAASLKRFAGEYTVDVHGSSAGVSVGDTRLGAHELAELVRADPEWRGRPVRLFSCNTGQGPQPIAAGLARELDVNVTAPRDLVWSNSAGESWVGSYEWKVVGGTMQRVPGAPQADGWSTFDPDSEGKGRRR